MCIIFIFQYFSKSKEVSVNLNPDQKKIGDRIFWKYMIVFQLAKSADWCLGPYLYEFFEKYHGMSVESTAQMIAISFLSNLLLGPLLVGFLNDKSNKKFPCLLYGVLLSTSCLVRQIKNPAALITSQIAFGMSSSVLYTSFENWFVTEINLKVSDKNVKDLTLSAAFEKSMIGDSITAVAVSVITGNLKKIYGIQAPYFFSVFLSSICFIISCLLITTFNNSKIDDKKVENNQSSNGLVGVFKNIKTSLIACKNDPFIILIGLTESMLFAVLHIFIFSWTPTLKELKKDVDTGEVFTLFMISLMVGGSSFRVNYFLNYRQYIFSSIAIHSKLLKLFLLFASYHS
jgi:MFS family permease